MNLSTILVTGASGFVGHVVCECVLNLGMKVRGSCRSTSSQSRVPEGVEKIHIPSVDGATNWSSALVGVNVIVHTAARVHVLRDSAADPLTEFRRVNVAGTLTLARQAVDAGVRRFIFVSSIGVNGAETFEVPFTAEDKAAPHLPYAISKYEAELGLRQLAQETGLEVVIIRPPLVFGPAAPGNFNKLLVSVYRGIPLPLGAIHNRRSLVALNNLVDLIVTCLNHPAAANQTFLVSDGEDLSTTELLRRTAAALGRPARLIPVPVLVLRAVARLLGRANFAQQLCGSLQVDISKTRNLLGWTPPVSVDDTLKQTARHFLANRDS
jgi:nucleoside-diphosphate-sugar epimerase